MLLLAIGDLHIPDRAIDFPHEVCFVNDARSSKQRDNNASSFCF